MSVLTDSRVCFQRGQTIGQNDLNIRTFNNSIPAVPTDPFDIKYSIFDKSSGTAVLVGLDRLDPVRLSVGYYYIAWSIPVDANIGDWQVIYYLKDTPTSQEQRVIINFCVVNPSVQTYGLLGNLSSEAQEMIRRLRVILRDNNPDRNYHFRPPTKAEVVQTYTKTFDYIWEDEELWTYILMGLDMVNASPPQTFWVLPDQIPSPLCGCNIGIYHPLPCHWMTIVLLSAAIFASRALQTNWVVDEFNYSISGISLDLERSSKYSTLADTWQGMFESALERAKGTVKLSRGLLQQPGGAISMFRSGVLNRTWTISG